jgi:hypothetical protein
MSKLTHKAIRLTKNQRPTFFASVFRHLDQWLVSRRGWKYIPTSATQYFYVDIHKYHGQAIVLSDQVMIKPGDLVGEIHLDSNKLRNLDLNLRSIMRLLRQELKALALVARDDQDFQEVRAYWCRTVLHAFLTRAGFTTRRVDSPALRVFLVVWENGLKYVYTKGRFRLRIPMESWISKQKLVERINLNDQ